MNDLYKERDGSAVKTLFGKIAKQYDTTNAILSFQMHTLWNQKLVHSVKGPILLDLCAGTGEIAYRFLKKQHTPQQVILLDFCPEMLEIAKTKKHVFEQQGHTLQFIQADAASIPLADNSVDSVSIAYGIRNVVDRTSCLKEVHRVLKPGGTFSILELTEPKRPLLAKLHRFYLNRLLPKIGGFLTKEKEAYQYLSNSIQEFIKPEELKKSLLAASFRDISVLPLTFGIATLIQSKK